MATRIFHSYDKFAYKAFGNYARKHRADYFDLELDLKKANVTTPLDIYVARMFFMSLLIGLAAAVLVAALIARVVTNSDSGTLFGVPASLVGNPLGTLIGNALFMTCLIVLVVFFGVFIASILIYSLLPPAQGQVARVRDQHVPAIFRHVHVCHEQGRHEPHRRVPVH